MNTPAKVYGNYSFVIFELVEIIFWRILETYYFESVVEGDSKKTLYIMGFIFI